MRTDGDGARGLPSVLIVSGEIYIVCEKANCSFSCISYQPAAYISAIRAFYLSICAHRCYSRMAAAEKAHRIFITAPNG